MISWLTLLTAAALAAPPTLADLDWIAGNWRGERAGAVHNERWGTPIGPTMVGTFVLVEDGQTRFYEIIVIEQTDEGPVMRIKHFGAGLVGWEEKDEQVTFPLAEVDGHRAVFRSDERHETLTYERTGNELLIRLEKPGEDGPRISEFTFTRSPSAALLRGPKSPGIGPSKPAP